MKTEINIPYKLVLIKWEDSQLGFQGWKNIYEQDNEVPVYLSVGFLVYEDEKCKVLYPHVKNINDRDELAGSGDILIPFSCIKEITEIPLTSFS